jgi:hypothetical protein
MAVQDIEQAYWRLLQRVQGSDGFSTVGDERRVHPRFTVDEPEIVIRSEIRVPALDVSISGIAFRSPLRFEVGRVFSIRVGSAISGDARVVACEPDRGDALSGPIEYRVRCTFAEDTVGMPLVVVLNDHVAGVVGAP